MVETELKTGWLREIGLSAIVMTMLWHRKPYVETVSIPNEAGPSRSSNVKTRKNAERKFQRVDLHRRLHTLTCAVPLTGYLPKLGIRVLQMRRSFIALEQVQLS